MTEAAAGNMIFIALCVCLVFMLLFLFAFVKMNQLSRRIDKLEDAQNGPEDSMGNGDVTE